MKRGRAKGKKSLVRLLLGWFLPWETGLSSTEISRGTGKDAPCRPQSSRQEADIYYWLSTPMSWGSPRAFAPEPCVPRQSCFLWLRKKSCRWKARSSWGTHLHGLGTAHCSCTELRWIEGCSAGCRSVYKRGQLIVTILWPMRTQTRHSLRG